MTPRLLGPDVLISNLVACGEGLYPGDSRRGWYLERSFSPEEERMRKKDEGLRDMISRGRTTPVTRQSSSGDCELGGE